MKHIKTFEKLGQSFWIYTYLSSTFPQINDIQIFESRESAESFLINEMNEMKKEMLDINENTIFTYNEATDYINDNELAIFINEVKSLGNYKLPEELVIGGDLKKYNL